MEETKNFIYTQEDMDNITNKVRETERAKIEKNYVSLNSFKELETKYNDLVVNNKQNEFKNIFIKNGGKESAYNDFINNHKDLLNMEDEEEIKSSLENIKEQKSFYFETSSFENDLFLDDQKEMKELFGVDENEELVEGTMYRKTKI